MGRKTISLFLAGLGEIVYRQKRQELLTGNLLMKINELAGKVNAISDQLTKASTEINAQLEVLRNADLPDEAVVALDRIAAVAQALDDLNPDAPIQVTDEAATA